jgi:UDP-N-acetylglucosamine 2-epimerase
MNHPALVHIVGARPQFIKMAVVLDAYQGQSDPIIIHTGQHYDAQMSQVFFDELSIPKPHYNLDAGGGSHGVQTGKMMAGIEEILQSLTPGVALVYGDTNSTIAAALVAAKLGWSVVHVEAGLRSFDRTMPEELNRIAVDHLSTHLLCPTHRAMAQLKREGLDDRAYFTGDVMLDASLRALVQSHQKPLGAFLSGQTSTQPEWLKTDGLSELKPGQYAVATVHRAANTDDPVRLKNVLTGLSQLPWPVLLPLHPRTRNCMARYGIKTSGSIIPLNPIGYLDFAALIAHSRHVFTDSGGVQKEAIFHGRLCTTMRDTTEWPETLTNGWNMLVDSVPEDIIAAGQRSQPDSAPPLDDFGGGRAGQMVNEVVARALNET